MCWRARRRIAATSETKSPMPSPPFGAPLDRRPGPGSIPRGKRRSGLLGGEIHRAGRGLDTLRGLERHGEDVDRRHAREWSDREAALPLGVHREEARRERLAAPPGPPPPDLSPPRGRPGGPRPRPPPP